MPLDPAFATAIGSIESGGQSDPYTTMGPATKGGDRAHGKYQVMGANIGPWSREVLGTELTPEQFLASPQAQDAVFQGKFGQYVDKYGPEGAAKAWFAGEKGMTNPNAKDALGTSVADYAGKFNKALGAPQPPPQQPAGVPSVPASFQPMPAYGWTPNNAPAGVSGAQPSQEMPPMAGMTAPDIPKMPFLGGPRHPPDLTQLKTLLARSPGQSRGFSFSRTS